MNEYEVNQCVESFYLPGYVDKSADRAILEQRIGSSMYGHSRGNKTLGELFGELFGKLLRRTNRNLDITKNHCTCIRTIYPVV